MLRVVSVVLSVVVLALSVELRGLVAFTVELGSIPSVLVMAGGTVAVVGGTVVVSVVVGGTVVVSVEEEVGVVNTTVLQGPVCIQKYNCRQYNTLLVKQLSEDVPLHSL